MKIKGAKAESAPEGPQGFNNNDKNECLFLPTINIDMPIAHAIPQLCFGNLK